MCTEQCPEKGIGQHWENNFAVQGIDLLSNVGVGKNYIQRFDGLKVYVQTKRKMFKILCLCIINPYRFLNVVFHVYQPKTLEQFMKNAL